jgi:GNAT superfamily N-acetyltransferase
MRRGGRAVTIRSDTPETRNPPVSITTVTREIGAYERHIRKATTADLGAAAYVLAAAFHDDPTVSWLVPDHERRRAMLPAIMELFAEHFQPHGENHVNEAGSGAALWQPPDAAPTPESEERLGSGLVALAGEDIARFDQLRGTFEANHPTEPHYYLMLLGVIPDRQGAGIGSALLHAVLDRADREHMPAYLEATSPRNRALFERRGFVVVDELRTGECPPVWGMVRRPHTSRDAGSTT